MSNSKNVPVSTKTPKAQVPKVKDFRWLVVDATKTKTYFASRSAARDYKKKIANSKIMDRLNKIYVS